MILGLWAAMLVAGADPGQGPAVQRLGRHVQGRRKLSRRARQAAIGHERHLATLVLPYAEQRRQAVHLRHAALCLHSDQGSM